MEDKGYGGAPGSGIVKGEVSLTKETASVGIQAHSECQRLLITCGKGAWDPVPVHPVPLKLPDTGSSVDTHMGHHGLPGLDDTTVLGQDFLFAMALQTALTPSNMARTKSKWDNDDYILLSLLFFFFISMCQ